jgi:putative membrane protein
MRLLLTLPVLLLLVLFALSNTGPVRLGVWPTDWSVELPVAVAVLTVAGVAFVAGALIVWLGQFGRRAALRRAEQKIRRLEIQLRDLQPGADAGRRPIGPPT